MTVVDQHQVSDIEMSADPLTSIVIAGNPATRQRIVSAMNEHGLEPSTHADFSELEELDMGDSTIVVFVCDLDVSQEISGLRRLCREAGGSAIVVISPPATGAGVRRALDAGADALVFEPELELTLVATIHAVASGQSVVPRKFRASVERPTLSHREHQVLALVRQGLTNAQIANRLFLAESTVKSHLGSVFTKFGVHSRREATAVFADLEQASELRPAGVVRRDPAGQRV